MTNLFKCSHVHPTAIPTPSEKLFIWLGAVACAGGLAFLRVATDAEFAFASAVILPVVAVAWFVNKRQGITFSLLAAIVWGSSDIQTSREFSADWIPWVNGMTRFGVYALVAYLTSSLREVLIREYEMARHDPLTGLLNRRSFFEVGVSEAARAKRYGHSLGIIFLDLDNFKRLNDARGHEVGDQALKAVSNALLQILRSSDSAARLGGDEFSVVLPETSSQASIKTGHKVAQALCASLKNFTPVSVSVGIACFDKVSEDFPHMVSAADALMYEIKKEGKGGVRAKCFNASADSHDAGEFA